MKKKNYKENSEAYRAGYDRGWTGPHPEGDRINPYPQPKNANPRDGAIGDRGAWYRGSRDGAWDNGGRAY